MTTLSITADLAKKRLKVEGRVAAGEKVAVTVKGFGDKSVSNTRLRVMFAEKVVAIFPLPNAETGWTKDGEDLTGVLNLNTVQAEMITQCGSIGCFWVLDDVSDEVRQLYGTAEHELLKWVKCPDTDVPVDLDSFPTLIEEMQQAIETFKSEIRGEWTNYQQTLSAAWTQYRDSLAELYRQFTNNVSSLVNGKASAQDLNAHTGNKSNPHEVTKTQVGLGNVDNTRDVDKPVSSQQQTAINSAKEQVANLVQSEARRATGKEQELQNGIDAEGRRASSAESDLDLAIRTEKARAEGAENELRESIKYVRIEFDQEPTEGSQKAARSGGIWAWVKRLVTGKLAAKPLPKYLHALSFDDTYPADAEAWYESLAPDAMGGACSAVRRGGKLYRNYDWTFDSTVEFVVRMSAAEGRHASVGVASLGAALTEDEVMSGVYAAKYRALPGMTIDGINDAGVVCEINVDGGPKTNWHGTGANALHILAAVRWVLDHGETAQQAAEYIAANVKQPTGEMNFHFMVADATETYIVENGEAHDVTSGTKVLTNYALYDDAHTGGGKERYQLLAGGEDISAVNWTNAYQSGNDWHSDFESEAQHAAAIEQWAAQGTGKEAHRGKTTTSGKPWWQTVHTSEFDFAAKTMEVAVQESGEYFTFAAGAKADVAWDDVKGKPETFSPSAHTHTQGDVTGLSDVLASKRGKDDLDITEPKNVHWVWTSDDAPDGWLEKANAYGAPKPEFEQSIGWRVTIDGHSGDTIGSGSETDTSATLYFGNAADPDFIAKATRESATDTTPVKVDEIARKSQLSDKLDSSDVVAPSPDASQGKAADAKATGDALKDKADEYSAEWVTEGLPSGVTVTEGPEWLVMAEAWTMRTSDGLDWASVSGEKEDAKIIQWYVEAPPYAPISTRKRVLRTGEALTPGLDDDGVPTDPNVRDLFSKSDTSQYPSAVAGALKNAMLEKSIVLAVTSNFADADNTSYGSAS